MTYKILTGDTREVLDRDDIVATLEGRWGDFYGQFTELRMVHGDLRGACPIHQGDGPNFSVKPATGEWYCHSACDSGGDVFAFIMALRNCDFKAALEEVGTLMNVAPKPYTNGTAKPAQLGPIVATYDYVDEGGKVLFQVTRHDPKTFRQRHLENGSWVYNLKGVRRVLYRLPEVVKAVASGQGVYIVEGEKDVDTLRSIGVTATCNPMGAGKWSDEYTAALIGAQVAIIPDNDPPDDIGIRDGTNSGPGQRHAEMVARSLYGKAKSVRIIKIPELGEKGDVSDWIARGAGFEDLRILARATALYEPPPPTAPVVSSNGHKPHTNGTRPPPVPVDTDELSVAPAYSKHGEVVGLPIIECNGRQMRHVSADALQALVHGNDPPTVFVSQGSLARLKQDGTGKFRPDQLTVDTLTGILGRRANWVKDELKDVPPPPVYVRDVLTLGQWTGVPELKSIVTSPCLSPSLTMIDAPGYDSATGIYYDAIDDIANVRPTVASMDAAKALIFDEVLVDFPFKDDSSRANAVALMLLPILRPAIRGRSPLTVIDAPTPGTGKSLLAEVILSLYSPGGVASRVCPPQDDEAEWRKQITSALLAQSQFYYLDNVKGALVNPALQAAITNTGWVDRPLGARDQVEFHNSMIFVVTANNIIMDNELSRRSVWVRLDANRERPEERDGFRHADIRKYVTDNRTAILAALLTIVRAWVEGGCKPAEIRPPTLGGFESYVEIVAGVVEYICTGFLQNRGEQQSKSVDAGPWHAFVEEWWESYRTRGVATADLFSLGQKHLGDLLGDKGEASQTKRLALSLRRNVDRVYSGKKIVSKGNGSSDVSSARSCEIYRLQDTEHPDPELGL